MTSDTTARHICPLCEASCGLAITVENNEVTLVRGDREDVFSRGFLCPKGTALKALQNDPDRLRQPLIKRDGRFVEVDFDEAFAEVERGLLPVIEEHGRLACGLVIGNPTVHRTGLVLYALDLAATLGSPNVFTAASIDQQPKNLSVGRMFGDFYSISVPDIERTELLVVIGANPIVSNGSMWSVPDFRGKAAALQERGGRIVTVDPRRTETAARADQHHFIRPGTDVFLLSAMANVMFEENLVDLGRLEPFVNGVDRVRAAVAAFTPEGVADTCGISASSISSLARDLATARRSVIYGRIGTCLQRHATLTSWLIDVLNALTGNLDEPGGSMFALPPAFASNTEGEPRSGNGVTTGAYRSRVSGFPEIMNTFPMACLAEEITTPGRDRIRSLITMASNPALSAPSSDRMTDALEQLDFMVSLDIYLNETTRHANVILPGPSPLEEGHYDVFFSQFGHRNVARYSPAALPKPDTMLDDWETVVRLIGIVMGRGSAADPLALDDALLYEMIEAAAPGTAEQTMHALEGRYGAERRLDLALRTGPYGDYFGANPAGLSLDSLLATPSGIDFGPLTPRLPDALRTRSGQVELAPSEFIDALDAARAEIDTPPPACVLIGRRQLRSNNTWMHNLEVLAKGRFRCTLLVNPADAEDWDLTDGEPALIGTNSSSRTIEAIVEIDQDMMRGVVSLPHGWGHDQPGTQLNIAAERPGPNLNALTDADNRDPLSGNPAMNQTPVTVSPVKPQNNT